MFKSPTPPRYHDRSGAPAWPPEALDGLKELDLEIGRLRSRRERYLREKAYELGLAAETLADLRSERGNPFAESERYSRESYRRAREEDAPRHDEEWAYWCGFESFDGKEQAGCGWVRGVPRSESYDDIGFLAGSAGERHFCQICQAQIGEDRHVVS